MSASKFSEALERKWATLRFLEREGRDLGPRPNDTPESIAIREDLRQMLPHAEAYYWSKDIAAAVLDSCESLPDDTTINLAGIPNHGWMWFEREHAPGVMSHYNPVKALSWHFDPSLDAVMVWSYGSPADYGLAPVVNMCMCVMKQGFTLSELKEGGFLPVKKPSDADLANRIHLEFAGFRMARFWVAAMLWIQQTIIVPDRITADRGVRRRLSREGVNDAIVNVVRLRRAERNPHGDAPGEPVEWSCQWIVRGHWRQQYYPSTNERKPLWIFPYVKGPDDAPLKSPPPTVFAVCR